MGFQVYPQKGLLTGKRGLNLVDYLLNIGPLFTLKSKNVYFFRGTLRRRRGFTRHSTEDWSGFIWRGGFEFLDNFGNARLLVARDNGDVKEIQSASASASVISGLGTGREAHFAAGFGSAFLVNGDDTLRRIDATSNGAVACTARIAGVPAKPTLAVSAGTAGGQTGDYAVIATSVVEDAGTKLLESDWSDIQQITLADQKLSGTVTPPAPTDSRITHFYIYRSDAGGAAPKFLTKVTVGSPSFTNVNVADTALGVLAPLRGKNIAPPSAPELIAFAGSRCILAKGSTLHISPRSLNAYDVEAFPHQVTVPGPGKIKALFPIPNPGGTPGTNSLLVLKETSCHVLFSADPAQPIAELSPEVGLIYAKAIAARGKGVFWVDRKRGVMWWPGEGRDVFGVGDRISSVITGEGYQAVPANIGDENVSLTVWQDKLLLTVRDDSSKTGPNKVYLMDLLAFERGLGQMGPQEAAAWAGPWEGPGFYRLVARLDGTLINLDNQNRYLTKWDLTTFKDYIGGVATAALPTVRLGTCLAEVLEMNKRIHQVYAVLYANQASKLRLIGEEFRFDIPDIALTPANYGDIPFEDITPEDIPVAGQAWKSEGEIDWSAVSEWFVPELSTVDGENDWIWVGVKMLFTRIDITRTYV